MLMPKTMRVVSTENQPQAVYVLVWIKDDFSYIGDNLRIWRALMQFITKEAGQCLLYIHFEMLKTDLQVVLSF